MFNHLFRTSYVIHFTVDFSCKKYETKEARSETYDLRSWKKVVGDEKYEVGSRAVYLSLTLFRFNPIYCICCTFIEHILLRKNVKHIC